MRIGRRGQLQLASADSAAAAAAGVDMELGGHKTTVSPAAHSSSLFLHVLLNHLSAKNEQRV